MKNWKKQMGILAGLALLAGAPAGCSGQAALEDRTYVESLHIIPEDGGYQYQCTLAYVDSDSAKYLRAGLDGAVMGTESTEQGRTRNFGNSEEAAEGSSTENTDGEEMENQEISMEHVEKSKENTGSLVENTEEKEGSVTEGDSEGTEEEKSSEYTAVAGNIEEFNQEYYRLTGSNFDYSHLQGIYLDASLYQPKLAEAVLKDIREATQVVLSTPIYQEGLAIGEQQETTLGDWLKEGR